MVFRLYSHVAVHMAVLPRAHGRTWPCAWQYMAVHVAVHGRTVAVHGRTVAVRGCTWPYMAIHDLAQGVLGFSLCSMITQ